MRSVALMSLTIVSITILGCGAPPTESMKEGITTSSTWSPIPDGSMTDHERDALDRAGAARSELMKGLLTTLRAEIDAHGPAGAIHVCRVEAPRLAREASEKHGLRIGRTSRRLRNPQNAPPPWAAPFVESQVEETLRLRGPAGDFAVLFPIRTATACLACHGPRNTMGTHVREALTELYPDDRATGFREGDLRGWFWVEVPADSSTL